MNLHNTSNSTLSDEIICCKRRRNKQQHCQHQLHQLRPQESQVDTSEVPPPIPFPALEFNPLSGRGFARLLILALIVSAPPSRVVVDARKLPPIFWNSTNPMFSKDPLDHIYTVRIRDRLDIVCPQKVKAPSDGRGLEYSEIYMVSKWGYRHCKLDSDKKYVGSCRNMTDHSVITVVFREFTPMPNGLEFKTGHSYYFITTSTGSHSGVLNKEGGLCSTKHMRVRFDVTGDHRTFLTSGKPSSSSGPHQPSNRYVNKNINNNNRDKSSAKTKPYYHKIRHPQHRAKNVPSSRSKPKPTNILPTSRQNLFSHSPVITASDGSNELFSNDIKNNLNNPLRSGGPLSNRDHVKKSKDLYYALLTNQPEGNSDPWTSDDQRVGDGPPVIGHASYVIDEHYYPQDGHKSKRSGATRESLISTYILLFVTIAVLFYKDISIS